MSSVGVALADLLFLVLVFLLAFYVSTYAPFKRDPHNPYRRHCMRCGQRQEVRDRWWVAMGEITNRGCNCHFWTAG